MPLYRVMTNPDSAKGPLPWRTVFVRDKFSWLAFLLPPVFTLVHGMWIETASLIVIGILMSFVSPLIGGEAMFWAYLILAWWFGYEASAMRVAALKHRGFIDMGDVVAGDEFLAEKEYLMRRSAM